MRWFGLKSFSLALILFATPVSAAITHGVGQVSNTFAAANGALTINGTTVGGLLVVAVVWDDVSFGAQTISSITISGESNATLVAATKFTNVSGETGELAYLLNNTGGGNKTVTVNMSNPTYFSASVIEYLGQSLTGQPDNSGVATGTNTPTTSFTTIAANSLIIAFCNTTGGEPTAGTNYTLWPNGPFVDQGWYQEAEDWLDSGAAGSHTVSFGSVTTGVWGISRLSFAPSGGGGGGTTVRHRMIEN